MKRRDGQGSIVRGCTVCGRCQATSVRARGRVGGVPGMDSAVPALHRNAADLAEIALEFPVESPRNPS